MAYCEIAKHECPYLGDAKTYYDILVTARATEQDPLNESVADAAADILERIIETDTQRCAIDYCGLVGSAVLEMLRIRSRRMFDEDRGVNGG